jgi:hypothetical protein
LSTGDAGGSIPPDGTNLFRHRIRINCMVTRTLTALGVLVSAVVHFWLWYDGFRDIEFIGPSFMLNAVAGLVIAIAVMTWHHWLPLLAAVGFGFATLVAFIISATVGLFGFNEVFVGTWQLIAAASEIVAIVAGAVALWQENHVWLAERISGQSSHSRLVRRPRYLR